MVLSDFQTLQDDAHAVFSAMYLIDVEKLSSEQRQQHQQSLSAAYLAWVNAENAKFDLLSSQSKTELAGLLDRLGAIRAGVSGLATPPEKLGVLAQGLDVLARLAKITG